MPSRIPSASAEPTPRSSSGEWRTAPHSPPHGNNGAGAPADSGAVPADAAPAAPAGFGLGGLSLDEVEARIGYTFSSRDLLAQALTHRSFSQECFPPAPDNERLEFLGDAVLQLIVTERLWRDFPGHDEGVLTRLRAERVNGRSLAGVFARGGFGAFLRLGKGEEKTGGRDKISIQAGGFEALVGAVYLDGGYARCAQWTESWFWVPGANEADVLALDFKSRLQQLLQERGEKPPAYRLIGESGPDHEKQFEVEARLRGEALGHGRGATKKAAEQAAAEQALRRMEEDGG